MSHCLQDLRVVIDREDAGGVRVVPVVQDGLQQVGVAVARHRAEEVPRGHHAPGGAGALRGEVKGRQGRHERGEDRRRNRGV